MDALFFDVGWRAVEDAPISRILYWFGRALERRRKAPK